MAAEDNSVIDAAAEAAADFAPAVDGGDAPVRARALARNLPISPQKGRLAAALIRGLSAGDAVERLQFSRQKAGGLLRKVLNSAIANAEENHSADIDALVVDRVVICKGAVMKRYQFGARGRVGVIGKQYSHFLVELVERHSGGRKGAR